MIVALQDLLNLYVFSTGRRLFALKQVHKLAKERDLGAIEAQVAKAIKHDKKTRSLELRWAKQGAPSPEQGEAPRVDALVDRALTALRDAAQAHADGAEPGDKVIKMVNDFLAELMPAGLHEVTHLSYVDELSAVEQMVEKLKGKLAPRVAELSLKPFVDRLEKLLPRYEAALKRPKDRLDFGDVRAARAQGQDLLLQAVVMILGTFPTNSPAHAEGRSALLTPILEQNEAIRQYMRGRRGGSVTDVDPETGEPEVGTPSGTGEEPEGGEVPAKEEGVQGGG